MQGGERAREREREGEKDRERETESCQVPLKLQREAKFDRKTGGTLSSPLISVASA